jgi:hypothetical protein
MSHLVIPLSAVMVIVAACMALTVVIGYSMFNMGRYNALSKLLNKLPKGSVAFFLPPGATFEQYIDAMAKDLTKNLKKRSGKKPHGEQKDGEENRPTGTVQ